jgi:hypothetical protein
VNVVLLIDPHTGETDAHGSYSGMEATVTADRFRRDCGASGLADVQAGMIRLHRPAARIAPLTVQDIPCRDQPEPAPLHTPAGPAASSV